MANRGSTSFVISDRQRPGINLGNQMLGSTRRARGANNIWYPRAESIPPPDGKKANRKMKEEGAWKRVRSGEQRAHH
jgi:hypothetical protein